MSNQQEEYEYHLAQQQAQLEAVKLASAVAHGMKHIGLEVAKYLDDSSYRMVMDTMDKNIQAYLSNCGYLKDPRK
jgi:hypothetical protein